MFFDFFGHLFFNNLFLLFQFRDSLILFLFQLRDLLMLWDFILVLLLSDRNLADHILAMDYIVSAMKLADLLCPCHLAFAVVPAVVLVLHVNIVKAVMASPSKLVLVD